MYYPLVTALVNFYSLPYCSSYYALFSHASPRFLISFPLSSLLITFSYPHPGHFHLIDAEHTKALQQGIEETTATAEAEKARALKLEASKWKQALKEAEKRVALEVNQAKEQGREEREAELLIEFQGAKESQQLSIDQFVVRELEASQVTQQHLDKINALESALASQRQANIQQQLALEQQLRAELERDKDQAVLTAEANTRAALALEWTDRMCREIAVALDQAAVMHQNELTKRDELQRAGMILFLFTYRTLSSSVPYPYPSHHILLSNPTSYPRPLFLRTRTLSRSLSRTSFTLPLSCRILDVEQVRELLQAEISATLAERSQAIGTHH